MESNLGCWSSRSGIAGRLGDQVGIFRHGRRFEQEARIGCGIARLVLVHRGKVTRVGDHHTVLFQT